MYKRGRKEQQISMDDPFMNLPKSIVENLRKSWAEDFYNDIFLFINEDRFSVLYSQGYSRPNKPVNIMVSLLILKELHDLTDDQLIGSLYFDYRYQYALGISDYEKETICINTLTNFRQRLVAYEAANQVDLLKQETDDLSNKLADIIELDRSMARMDSFMLSSSCKKLTRLELVYKVNQNMVKALFEMDPTFVPEPFQDYLHEGHQNQLLYHTKSEEVGSKLDAQIDNAAALYRYVVTHPEWLNTREFQHLSRLLKEQCIETEEGVVIPTEAKKIAPDSLQNPSDPDATYRQKSGKGNIGYSVNLVEVRDPDKEVGMILSHDIKNNLYHDAQFGEDFIHHDPLADEINVLAADGAYHRQSTMHMAMEKNVEFNLSNMTGRKTTKETLGVDQFEQDDSQIITSCPAGHAPEQAKFDPEKQVYTAKFAKDRCTSCPLREQCPVQEQKKFNNIRFTENKLQTDKMKKNMNTERHRELSRFRAGIEGIVSALRRGFHVDDLPVRGLLRSKIWIHAKILAYNFKSMVKYKDKSGKKLTSKKFRVVMHRKIQISTSERFVCCTPALKAS
jgi:hypothetical protein